VKITRITPGNVFISKTSKTSYFIVSNVSSSENACRSITVLRVNHENCTSRYMKWGGMLNTITVFEYDDWIVL